MAGNRGSCGAMRGALPVPVRAGTRHSGACSSQTASPRSPSGTHPTGLHVSPRAPPPRFLSFSSFYALPSAGTAGRRIHQGAYRMVQRGAAPKRLVMAPPEDGIRRLANFSRLVVPVKFAHGERRTLRYCGSTGDRCR
ncbi:hypothetical protein B0T21DRAFT_2407 [Apiosordaria backusii]|uniref:Uncharacterized protein n=1 Tax=Apiosordaria backusii TaxID=314023 RepID=A0AA40EXI9_9PEZI|nr:hypothetical protein B0T21DRAFT_2407 [Apiosordaria backusii]